MRELGLLILFVGVTAFLWSRAPGFGTTENLRNVVRDQGYLAILATAMTLVILTGGIDLSAGSSVALSAVALGLAWRQTGSWPAAILAGLAAGTVCGAVNGALVAFGRMPPLIVTLATLSVYRGLAFAFGGSDTIKGFPQEILSWSRYDLLGLPAPLWLTAGLFLGAGTYLSRTAGGRAIYAVGANAAASRLSGIAVQRLRLKLYTFSGLMAGLAAILYAARNDSVRADIGVEYELNAITVVVLGGTSVAGGVGTMLGTALGYFLLIFLQNGLNLMGPSLGLPREFHGVVVAVLLIGALLMDAGFARKLRT